MARPLLHIGAQAVPLEPGLAFRAAIDAANRVNRVDGVPDTLNPGIVDADKAAGFVASLSSLPAATAAQLDGHELALDADPLGLSAAAPTRADAFAHATVTVDSVQGRHVLARSGVVPDAALARARAGEARAALAQAGSRRSGGVRRRQSLIAGAWYLNAEAWSRASPGDPAAQVEFSDAGAAIKAFAMPSGALPD